jgi:hypothetical protein
MDWQFWGALGTVAAVAILLVRWKLKELHRRLTTPCAGDCACGITNKTGTRDASS